MYLVMSLFFLVAALTSANTYSSLVKAQRDISLGDGIAGVTSLPNGSIAFTFSISLDNPSRYTLRTQTVSFYALIDNSTEVEADWIVLASYYAGPTAYVEVDPKSSKDFSFDLIASDPDDLADLDGYLRYKESIGEEVTVESAPYTYDLEVVAWIGEFRHDYLRENYLNDLVEISLGYTGGGAS